MKVGDQVEYITAGYQSQWGGHIYGKKKIGNIEDIFPSMDGSFMCLWIRGELELITDKQVIQSNESVIW